MASSNEPDIPNSLFLF